MIDRGTRAGLVENDVVLNTDAELVGRIVEPLTAFSAQVRLITSSIGGTGAYIENNMLEGLLKGGSGPECSFQYLLANKPVRLGDRVITSGTRPDLSQLPADRQGDGDRQGLSDPEDLPSGRSSWTSPCISWWSCSMSERFRNILFLMLAVGQLAFARYYHPLRFTVDLLYLVIFFIAIRSGFMPSILSAALIGLCTDYLSGGVMGVFSFSRTLAAYFLNALARVPRSQKEYFRLPADPGFPVPVQPGGLRLPWS